MEPPASIATGVPQLDVVLGGGIVPSSAVLIVGSSGSGKTILTSQIACAMAARGERVLFITTFSNPHTKLITNLRRFQFFDPTYIGERIRLLNLQHQLTTSLEEAANTIVREAREHRAQYVFIDNLQSVRVVSSNESALHQFLYDLSAKLNMLGVTALMSYEPIHTKTIDYSEFMMVDTVLLLTREAHNSDVMRTLHVLKHRGMNHLLGQHTFIISDAGLVFYPRQETLPVVYDTPVSTTRVPFGITTLDDMLRGGLNQGTSTLIAGVEGSGKTTFGLQYGMQGVREGERTLFVTFYETPQQLSAKGQALGLDVAAAIATGALRIQFYPIVHLNSDLIAYNVRTTVEQHQIQRVVIDGIDQWERTLTEWERTPAFWSALLAFLRSRQTTTVMTTGARIESWRDRSYGSATLIELVDNLFVLQRATTAERYTHALTVLKMRFSSHAQSSHLYSIGVDGLVFQAPAQP